MAGSIRKWCICVLVAMLPLQGLAAATMALCDPTHHAHVAAVSNHDDGADHHAHPQAHDHAGEASSDDGAATALAGAGDAHKCSACAACCGAAVLPAIPSLESAAPGPARFPALATRVEAFAALVAERPPRSFRA